MFDNYLYILLILNAMTLSSGAWHALNAGDSNSTYTYALPTMIPSFMGGSCSVATTLPFDMVEFTSMAGLYTTSFDINPL